MWKRIAEIIRKEMRQTLREPRMRALLIGPPLIQLVIFGFAVNLDVDRARLGWMDLDATPASRDLRGALEGSGRFEIVATPGDDGEVRELLDRGEAQLVIRLLPGFERDIRRGETAAVQVLVEGSNSNTAAIVASYAAEVVNRYAATAAAGQQNQRMLTRISAGGSMGAALPKLSARTRVWFNPELKSRNYFVPGVVVNIISLVTLMLTAMAIVREKEIGTMEQLMVTPIRPIELMTGKLLPFAVVGMLDLALVTSLALLVFRVPFRGSLLLLVACSLLYMLTSLGCGLFLSTISQTQQQAMMSAFMFFMPAFMLSGFAFPIRNMPPVVQWLSYLDPIRYFIEIVRGIFLKGTGIAVLWPQMAALLVFGLAIMGGSALRFHKRLD
jgi:ABC-2 type transport system permease protein